VIGAAPVLEHRAPRHLDHGVLAGDVDRQRKRAAGAVGLDQLGCDLLGALDITVGDNDVSAAGRE
jgi:hypothetical protein